MDLKAAISRLRRGKSVERPETISGEQDVPPSCPFHTSVVGESLFTLDDWDSFCLDEDDDIFKEGDGISFSPPSSQLMDMAEDGRSSSLSSKSSNDRELYASAKYHQDAMDEGDISERVGVNMKSISKPRNAVRTPRRMMAHQVENHMEKREDPAEDSRSRSAVQKLKSFKFIKTDRKRAGVGDSWRDSGFMNGRPPAKKKADHHNTCYQRIDDHSPNENSGSAGEASLRNELLIHSVAESKETTTSCGGGGSTDNIATMASYANVSTSTNETTRPYHSTSETARPYYAACTNYPATILSSLTSKLFQPSESEPPSGKVVEGNYETIAIPSSTLTSRFSFERGNQMSNTSKSSSIRSMSSRWLPGASSTQANAPQLQSQQTPEVFSCNSSRQSAFGLLVSSTTQSSSHSSSKRPHPSSSSFPSPSSSAANAKTLPITAQSSSVNIPSTPQTIAHTRSAGFPASTTSLPSALNTRLTGSARICTSVAALDSTPKSSLLSNLTRSLPNATPQKTGLAGLTRWTTPSLSLHTSSSKGLNTPVTPSVSCSSRRSVLTTPTSALVCTPASSSGSSSIEIMRTPVPLPQRKFPGPAGLLPQLIPGQNMDNIYIAPPSTPGPVSTPRLAQVPSSRILQERASSGLGSEGSGEGEFDQGPWVAMLGDLDLNDSHSSALLDYSISQAVRQFLAKQLKNGKVIHLRVMLKGISFSGGNASGILKDPTGEIMCTLHNRVLEEHKKELQIGAVLVLRQVSMFSPGPRRHYLNITPPNVVRIYPPDGTIRNSSPLALSEFEKNQSEPKDLGLPPPQLRPHLPMCKHLKSTSLQSPLFKPSTISNSSQSPFNSIVDRTRKLVSSNSTNSTVERNKLEMAISTLRSQGKLLPADLDKRKGCVTTRSIETRSCDLIIKARASNDSNTKSRAHEASTSCNPDIESNILCGSGETNRFYDPGSSTPNTMTSRASAATANASRSCDADIMFLTDICEDEFNDWFGDMVD